MTLRGQADQAEVLRPEKGGQQELADKAGEARDEVLRKEPDESVQGAAA